MSYCRWSSDNWRCDLYCYESTSGYWVTCVAYNRIIDYIPEIDWSASSYVINLQMEAQHEILCSARREDIGLPYDGEMFQDYNLEDLLDRILWLREVGYRCPDYVIEAIREEIVERDK